jgi:hypothetical protein
MGFIFYQDKQQRSIALMVFLKKDKSEPIGLFYRYIWYKL